MLKVLLITAGLSIQTYNSQKLPPSFVASKVKTSTLHLRQTIQFENYQFSFLHRNAEGAKIVKSAVKFWLIWIVKFKLLKVYRLEFFHQDPDRFTYDRCKSPIVLLSVF